MLVYGKIAINPKLHEVTCGGKRVSLKPKEYKLLTLFLQYPHHTLTDDFIIDQIWGSDQLPGEFNVSSHIRMLRESLQKCGESCDIIETVNELGYRLIRAKEKNPQPFPIISAAKTFFKAKNIEYLAFDQLYTIKFISHKLFKYCDYPERLRFGNYLGDAFPELIGLEKDIEKLRNKEGVLTLKEIARARNPQRPDFINFYIIANNLEDFISSKEKLFFVFIEDDSDNAKLRQKLVQHINETFLTSELESNSNNISELNR